MISSFPPTNIGDKMKKSIVICIVLCLFFSFQSNMAYAFSGEGQNVLPLTVPRPGEASQREEDLDRFLFILRNYLKTAAERFDLFSSTVVSQEVRRGDPEAAQRRIEALRDIPELVADSRAVELAIKLMDGKAVPKYGEKCRAAAGALLGEGRVKFFDFTNDLPSVYASSAFMAYPSLLEGFPLAMVEGMKYRLPVVAVDALPGVRDMVLDGETGLVAAPTVEAYSAALARLMSDGGLRAKMGEKAHAYCEERYSRESALSEWERLLARVAGE